MSTPLRVLVVGPHIHPVCDHYRFLMYRDLLAARGVELRTWEAFHGDLPAIPGTIPDQLLADGRARLDLSDIDWADVLLFRRFADPRPRCSCGAPLGQAAILEGHRTAGHAILPSHLGVIRHVWERLDADPSLLHGRAIVYETDDDLTDPQPWTGFADLLRPSVDLVKRMLTRADLVTVTTPALATVARRYTDAVRIVRNALDPAWFEGHRRREGLEGDPRVLYVGGTNRLRDWAVIADVVADVKRRFPSFRTTWLGSADPAVAAAVDEPLGWHDGREAYIRELVESGPDVGVAPLVGNEWDRGKSELHWLEYTLAGAVTIGTRMMGDGPYNGIRHGVDGFLAKSKAEWRAAFEAVAGSRDLRTEVVGRARERVLAEYDARTRVDELADAWRWAVEHAGRGTLGRLRTAAPDELEAVRGSAAAWRARRDEDRARTAAGAARLAAARGDRDVCWGVGDLDAPLVSVIVPAVGADPASRSLAVASALDQTWAELEVVVVVEPGSSAGIEALAGVAAAAAAARPAGVDGLEEAAGLGGLEGPEGLAADERPALRVIELAPDASTDPVAAALAAGIAAARGAWIAPLVPGTAFADDHVHRLLDAAADQRAELVIGRLVGLAGGDAAVLPWRDPWRAGISLSAALWSARLDPELFDPGIRPDGVDPTLAWSRRLVDVGVRVARLDAVVGAQLPAPEPIVAGVAA